MASGATHKAVTIGIAFGVAGVGVGLGYTASAIAASAGCLFGLWCQPDRDHVANKSLVWYWYSRVFKHRGISHLPLVGTCTRLAYLSTPFLLAWAWLEGVIWLTGASVPHWTIPQWILEIAAYWLTGLVLSDLGHWILDWHIWRPLRQSKRRTRTVSTKTQKGTGYESPPV